MLKQQAPLFNTLLTDRVLMSALFNLALASQCIQVGFSKTQAYGVAALLLYSAGEITIFRLIPSLVSLIGLRFTRLLT